MADPISTSPEKIASNLGEIRERMTRSAAKAHRDLEDIRLVAITKYVGIKEIRSLLKLGVKDLGENRHQVARDKIAELKDDVANAEARWHFIGHLQTNKVKNIVPHFSSIDAVDSTRLLEVIAKEAEKREVQPYSCLVEMNLSAEPQKFGLTPEELEPFLERANAWPACRISGLMAMAPYSDAAEETSRPIFVALRELIEKANEKKWYHERMNDLSMGMSQDYHIAIEEGATLIRVGSALFR